MDFVLQGINIKQLKQAIKNGRPQSTAYENEERAGFAQMCARTA